MDVDAFKEYVRAKNTLNAELCDFYGLVVHRKMKWRQFVYTQRSEDRFLGRMRHLYGDDALVAYGDWSRTTQMRHFVPTKGVGMRRSSRDTLNLSINEFRTSKLCCNCARLSHVDERGGNKNCSDASNENANAPKAKTRIRHTGSELGTKHPRLACDWICGQTRPVAFCRSATGLPTTAAAEKDGQSVDFTAHHGANLCNSGLDP